MVILFYLVLFLLSFALTIFMLIVHKKHVSVYTTLLFASIIVSNLGHMQLYSAQDLHSALYANQVIYLSACFTPFFSFMCVAELCRLKPNRVIQTFCVGLGGIIFACISTIGSNTLYYKSVDLVNTGEYSYLSKEYGPLHILYPIYLVAMMITALAIVINSFRNKKMISYITSTSLTAVMSFTVFTYLLERFYKLTIDFLPLSFVILQIVIVVLLNRMSLYDIASISGATMESDMKYGFVVCSTKGKFSGADHAARKWFPELDDLYIDYVIRNTDTDFLVQLQAWINGDTTEFVYFERDGVIVEARHKLISEKNSMPFHFVSLRDDTDSQKYLRLMENFNDKLETEVNEKTERLRKIQSDILISMANIVESRDNNTGGHIRRTSDIVSIFVSHLLNTGKFPQLTPETANCIAKAAPLHDFGKIAIPDLILNKPGKFNDEEYNEMKKHSEKGAVIVAKILDNTDDELFKRIAVNVAHYHHEKWNGTGYPTRISGTDIPFEARVMALADVFDALVSKRVYKSSFSYDKAFDIIRESSGEHFDPQLCKEFLACRNELETLYDSYTD